MQDDGVSVAPHLAYLQPLSTQGASYLVLGLLPEARTLRQAIDQGRHDRLKLLDALGRLVGHLHAAGWAHRDLNLKNVLVAGEHLHLIDVEHAVWAPRALRDLLFLHDLRRMRISGRNHLGRSDLDCWVESYARERGLTRAGARFRLALTRAVPARKRSRATAHRRRARGPHFPRFRAFERLPSAVHPRTRSREAS